MDCCGAPVLGVNDNLSYDLTQKKLVNAKKAGADFICVACPWCHMQFDKIQNQIASKRDSEYSLPSILYTQLLGLRLGIGKEELGIVSPENQENQDNELLKQAYSKLFNTEEKKEKKKKSKKKSIKKKAIK